MWMDRKTGLANTRFTACDDVCLIIGHFFITIIKKNEKIEIATDRISIMKIAKFTEGTCVRSLRDLVMDIEKECVVINNHSYEVPIFVQ
jgi:hypothetical protein